MRNNFFFIAGLRRCLNFSMRLLILLILCFFVYENFLTAQTLPEQPLSGPGGRNYLHDEVRVTDQSNMPDGFWIFEPASPTRDSAHVVVFLHGYGVLNPMIYGDWIEHLVRKGNTVIYPRYQKHIFPPRTRRFVRWAVEGIHQALDTLRNGDHTLPITRDLSIVGHSYGGALAANLGAKHQEYQLPEPVSVLLCSPGTGPFKGGLLDSYENIPAETKLLIMVSEKDKTVGDRLGKRVFGTAVNTTDKYLIIQRQDRRFKDRNIRAGHNESYSINEKLDVGKRTMVTRRAGKVSRLDAVDYFGYWKLLDALHNCTREENDCEYALGLTLEQAFMGYWSDGRAVKPLDIR